MKETAGANKRRRSGSLSEYGGPAAKLASVDGRLEEIAEQINNMQASLTHQIENVQDQTNDIENGLGLLAERVNMGAAGGGSDLSGLSELYKKVDMIQFDMETIRNTSAKLMQDAEDRASQLQSLAEQLQTLTELKADREELDEALLDKADKKAVIRKVSCEHFENALEHLSTALEDAVKKLTQQEAIWQDTLNEFGSEIAKKLDKQEMAPLKEFINKRLKKLHYKLKDLAKIRKQAEAAAAKKPFFKDLNCLACDVDAAMASEVPANVPLPPSSIAYKNIKPHLTYQLDLIRREKETFPAKNVLHLEEALAYRRKYLARDTEESLSSPKLKHVCNRYCGGSHTTTMPYQRVTRKVAVVRCAEREKAGPQAVGLSPERGPSRGPSRGPGRLNGERNSLREVMTDVKKSLIQRAITGSTKP